MPAAPSIDDLPTSCTADELWSLTGRLEHEQLDFKRQPKHITQEIAAMAMTDGGLLVLGVEDDRSLSGCSLDQRTFDTVMRAANACQVDGVQLREVVVDGVELTVVAVPEIRGRIVTTPDGRLVRRVGSDSQPLVGDALARFVREREDRPAEDEVVPALDDAGWDLELIDAALAADGRAPAVAGDVRRALLDLGVANMREPPLGLEVTTAAVLLFHRDPRSVIPGAAIQLVKRAGVGPDPGPVQERLEVTGPIERCLRASLEFLDRHLGAHEAVVGTHRERFPEYPTAVLREVLLNALGHRDYSARGTTTDVTLWDDRLEVRSPGALPGPITLENIRSEHYSRNRRIMRVLKLVDLVEEYGEGVDRMFYEMESRLMDPPSFSVSSASVAVSLRNRSIISVADQAWLSLVGRTDLSVAERRALVLAKQHGSVTPRRLRSAMTDVDAEAVLATAVAKGLLVRVGERGGTRYELSDEVIMRAGGAGVEARSRQRQAVLDEINRRGSLSTNEAAELLGSADRDLARALLADLVRAGDVRAEGRTRARRYYPLIT